ncbi:hypothetical protein PS687_05312 [Pseudomonas fluorescens]|nr:hypothetical protein PS664_05351 [Pseudomonas fluorescens]VVN67410.1 hypothetical protein PS687_05312 [Pseudomonas fluorescens]
MPMPCKTPQDPDVGRLSSMLKRLQAETVPV